MNDAERSNKCSDGQKTKPLLLLLCSNEKCVDYDV